MLRNIVYMMLIGISILDYAMETNQPKVCYLAQLPIEIRDIIAGYLDWDEETFEEFIARTKIYPTIAPEHKKMAKVYDGYISLPSFCRAKSIRTYSLDQQKLITFGHYYYRGNASIDDKTTYYVPPLIHIINVRDGTYNLQRQHIESKLSACLQDEVDTLETFCVSRDGRKVAYVWLLYSYIDHRFRRQDTYVSTYVKVKDIFSEEVEQNVLIPFYYRKPFVCFNKQTTALIIRSDDHSDDHTLIPLHTKVATYPKTLNTYLEKIGCCKNIESNRNRL